MVIIVNDAYQKSKEEILKEYKTTLDGLTEQEAKRRLNLYGKNILIEKNKKSKLRIFIDQFKNVMIILLLVVGLMSLFYAIFTNGDFLEPIVILGTSLINCFMGYLQESKAEDAIEKLKSYQSSKTTVKRDGKLEEINTENLVDGDYIILEAGDKVPADARIIESYFAKCDEAILTGESMSVVKNENQITKKVLLSERSNMVYSGTVVVAGKIEAIVKIENDHIISIEITSHHETANRYQLVLDSDYINQLVDNQNALDNLDTVSSATVTSSALKKLVINVLEDYNPN